MTNENLIKNIKIFSGKVKSASNITTILFLITMGYTINQWQKVSGFDSLINLLMSLLMLVINIKFYKIHLDLSNTNELSDESRIKSIYKLQKSEYKQLLLVSFAFLVTILILKLFLRT